MLPFARILESAFQCDVEDVVTSQSALSTEGSGQQLSSSTEADEEVIFTASPGFPSLDSPQIETDDSPHRAHSHRSKKMDKIDALIAHLRAERHRARADLLEFLASHGFNLQDVVAQWYPFLFLLGGSRFPYKVTNPKKGCPYYSMVTGLPRGRQPQKAHQVGSRIHLSSASRLLTGKLFLCAKP